MLDFQLRFPVVSVFDHMKAAVNFGRKTYHRLLYMRAAAVGGYGLAHSSSGYVPKTLHAGAVVSS